MTMNEPLPGMPAAAPGKSNTPEGWRVYRIHTARLCDRCCRDIHERGAGVAAYPQLARWRVTDGSTVERLCEGHRNERMDE